MDTLIGTSIGGYTLLRLLGSGGMGSVYLAEDPAIGQQVAIKIVRTDPLNYLDASSATFALNRFKQEARAVASLDHLHILPLYRYGEEETNEVVRAYMVMQYRPEGSLWDWMRRRAGLSTGLSFASASSLNSSWPLSLEEAGEYLRQAASALQYAHDRGIIHRDIKPGNFLIRLDEGNIVHLLLSDFGLAKFFSSSSATTHVFGTPTYMAPEQFDGTAGLQSDQYALAIMIYYLLVGRPPFEGGPLQLMHAHLNMPPPAIRMFNPSLPQSIERTLLRALAKNPAERYSSVAAFASAFSQCIDEASGNLGPRITLPTLPQYGRSALSISTSAALPDAAQVTPDGPTVLESMSGRQINPAFSPLVLPEPLEAATPLNENLNMSSAQNSIVISSPTSQEMQHEQRPMSRRSALGVMLGLGGAAIVGLGGGAGIYFFISNRMPDHALHVLKGHSDSVTSVYWSPNSSQLASGSRDNTARLWSTANEKTVVTYNGHRGAVLSVAWNPDGLLMASGGADRLVRVWDTQGTTKQSYSGWGGAISSVIWNNNGRSLFVGTLGAGAREVILSTGLKVGKEYRSFIHALALSPDGNRLAAAYESGSIVVVDLQGQAQRPISYHHHSGPALAVAWSPDGSLLASGGADAVAQVMDAAAGHIVRTLLHNGAVNGIAWEPTNTYRLATACADGNVRIWDGKSSTRTIYSGHTGAVNSIAWSSNGLASGSADTSIILWKV